MAVSGSGFNNTFLLQSGESRTITTDNTRQSIHLSYQDRFLVNTMYTNSFTLKKGQDMVEIVIKDRSGRYYFDVKRRPKCLF